MNSEATSNKIPSKGIEKDTPFSNILKYFNPSMKVKTAILIVFISCVLFYVLVCQLIPNKLVNTDDEYYKKYKQNFIETTGCANIYAPKIDGQDHILKLFTDDMRRTRETSICRALSKMNLESTPKFYHIGDHIITEKIKGVELRDYIKENKNNKEKLKRIITKVFNCIFELHTAGVVHANIQRRNIMIDNKEKAYLIDYCESWIGNEFYFDFLRLKFHVLDAIQEEYGLKWEELIDYSQITHPEALKYLMKTFFKSKSAIFWKWFNPNACRLNFQIVSTVSKILRAVGLDNIKDINERYIKLIWENI